MTEVVLQEKQPERSLYEEDIVLWVEDTVAKLKAGDFANWEMILALPMGAV